MKALASLLFILAIAFLVWPYTAVYRLDQALQLHHRQTLDELIDIALPDMVGIDEIRTIPAAGRYGLVSFDAGVGRIGPDYGVFPVGLVPDGNQRNACLPCFLYGFQLCFTLLGKAVSDSQRVLL